MTETGGAPIRVLHVVLDLHEGGLERVVVDLMRGMPADMVHSEVLCLRRRGQLADELPADAVHLVRPEGGILGMWLPRKLAAAIAERRPDVVHLHSGVWLKGARAARMAGVRGTVFTDHGRPWPDPLPGRIVDFLGSRLTDQVVAVSEPLRNYLAQRLRIPRNRIMVIRNAIAEPAAPSTTRVEEVRRMIGAAPGALIIGSVGRLDRVKAYDVLIRAVMLLRANWKGTPPPKLVIVGDGPDRERLEGVIASEGASSAVALVGWQREVRQFLDAMDCFVLSSDSEGTSISLLEAMQAGVPVVATSVGGNPDVLGEELASQLVPPQDSVALATRLGVTLRDPGGQASIGERGRKRVKSAFSAEATFSAYQSVYKQICSEAVRG